MAWWGRVPEWSHNVINSCKMYDRNGTFNDQRPEDDSVTGDGVAPESETTAMFANSDIYTVQLGHGWYQNHGNVAWISGKHSTPKTRDLIQPNDDRGRAIELGLDLASALEAQR